MKAGKYNIEHTAGASFTLELNLKKSDANAYDLTGSSAYAHVRKSSGGDTIIVDLSPTVSDAPNGVIAITIPDEITKSWKAGHWKWDLILELADGSVTEPVIAGNFTINQSITEKL